MGPHPKQLEQDLKGDALCLGLGQPLRIFGGFSEQAKAFALGDALGNRDWRQPRCLDEELGKYDWIGSEGHRFVVWSDIQGAHLDFVKEMQAGGGCIGKAIFSFQTATGANTSR